MITLKLLRRRFKMPEPTKTGDANEEILYSIDVGEPLDLAEELARLRHFLGEINPEENDGIGCAMGTLGNIEGEFDRLVTYRNITRALGTDDPEASMEKALEYMHGQLSDADALYIIKRDPKTGKISLGAKRLKDPHREEGVSHTILDRVLESKKAVLAGNAEGDIGAESLIGIRSIMCAPVLYENEVLGYILAYSHGFSRRFNRRNLEVVTSIASPIGLILANSILQEETYRLKAEGERRARARKNAIVIQRLFLPPNPPEVEGYKFSHYYMAAWDVAGDFYDYHVLPNDHVVVLIGDVSGKDMPAALTMAFLKGLRKKIYTDDPVGVLDEINLHSQDTLTCEQFATLLYMDIDPQNHNVTMVNAGHCPPFLRKAGGEINLLELEGGAPVVLQVGEYKSSSISLDPGNVIIAYSDGVTDATNTDGEMFGKDGLIESIEMSDGTPKSIVEYIAKALKGFRGDAEPADDITVLSYGRTA